MHCYNGKDMARSFRTVRNNTVKIAEEIPEDQYGFRAAPDVRTVAETLAHIAATTNFAQKMHGARMTLATMEQFNAGMQELMQKQASLTTKSQILDALRNDGEGFAVFLESLPDEALEEMIHFQPPIQMPPKSRFEMLLGTKEHEMHHRGQLMVIERMLGIVPHLTREQQERMAAMQAAAQPKSAGA